MVWFQACFACQARKTSRQTPRCGLSSLSLCLRALTWWWESFCCGPPPVTDCHGKSSFCCSRVVLAGERFFLLSLACADFTAKGTLSVMMNRFRLRFCSNFPVAILRWGTECVHHSMSQMPAVVFNEKQNDSVTCCWHMSIFFFCMNTTPCIKPPGWRRTR